MSVEEHRAFYAALVTAKAGADDPAIRSAFLSVSRERFAGPGPWQVFTAAGYIETPSDDPRFLYQDLVVALAPERGINNGEPSLHARCLSAAAPSPGEVVVHVGAGTGYYTALLASLVGATGSVLAFEIEADLAERARANLEDFASVEVRAASAITPDLPPSDLIYVSAGATRPPREWVSALKLGGRLIFPLTGARGMGFMLLIRREAERSYSARIVSPAAFIPCAGASDPDEAQAISAALMKGGHGAIRSLVLDEEPDSSSWLSGAGWSLSTREV